MIDLPTRRPAPRVMLGLVGVLCLIWGSTWLVIKEGLRDLPPITSAGIRFCIAAAIMVPVAAALGRREGGAAPGWRLSLANGVFNFAISYGLVYHAETVLPSGLVAVLWSIHPLLMGVVGHYFIPGERLSWRQAVGFLVGLAGVGFLFLTELRSFGGAAVPAALLLLLSPLSAAVGTAIVKVHGAHVSSLLLNRNAMVVGAVLLLTVGVLTERDQPLTWTPTAIGSLLYLALVGTVVTFGLFFWLLRFLPATWLGLISFVIPLVALTLGTVLGQEPLGIRTVIGSALIVAGVALALLRR